MKIQKQKTHKLTDKDRERIIYSLHTFLSKQTKLTFGKNTKLFCYYTKRRSYKKLLFYLNPRDNEVVFGISHRGTSILETYPGFKIIADEIRKSVIKFSIKNKEDIEKKGIKQSIEMILKEQDVEPHSSS